MSLIESLLEILENIDSCDSMIDGFKMEPTKFGYKVLLNNESVCHVSFINKDDKIERDMETAQDNPNDYDVVISEIKQDEKTELYINKLSKLGFGSISKKLI